MVYKRTYPTGKVVWGYKFDGPKIDGKRAVYTETGYKTKREATDAETDRKAQVKAMRPSAGSLRAMLEDFFVQHCERQLATKTVARYREMVPYLSDALLEMPCEKVTALDCTKEWNRLKDSGGRGKKAGKPLKAKTVRNIAGMVSSAYLKAKAWGLVAHNPVTDSGKPKNKAEDKKEQTPLTANQQALLLSTLSETPCLPIILELCAALGARRGEVMALRWKDLVGSTITIGRSLSQVKQEVFFKEPKTSAGYRTLTLPESTVKRLNDHRKKQAENKAHFGESYRHDLDLIICGFDGEPLKPDSISGTISNICRKLKLPKGTSLHTLRHTHGSQLLAGGMEITAVSARLGHASPLTTARVYAHAIKGRDAEAAKVWERMMGREESKEERTN